MSENDRFKRFRKLDYEESLGASDGAIPELEIHEVTVDSPGESQTAQRKIRHPLGCGHVASAVALCSCQKTSCEKCLCLECARGICPNCVVYACTGEALCYSCAQRLEDQIREAEALSAWTSLLRLLGWGPNS